MLIRQLVFSALLWITYALYWRVVLGRGVEREARLAGIILGAFVLLQFLLTQSWIAHNRRLARRVGARRQQRTMVEDVPRPTTDFLGRGLSTVPANADLTRVPLVIVRVEGTEKRFEAGFVLPEHPGERS